MQGTAAGKYANQLLKAGDAAQPKGCSARFVPVNQKIKNNRDFPLNRTYVDIAGQQKSSIKLKQIWYKRKIHLERI